MVREKTERRLKASAKQYAARVATYVDEAKGDIVKLSDKQTTQVETAAVTLAMASVMVDTAAEVVRVLNGRSEQTIHGAQMMRLWLKMLVDGIEDCIRNAPENGETLLLCEMFVKWVSDEYLQEGGDPNMAWEMREAEEGPFGLLTRSVAEKPRT